MIILAHFKKQNFTQLVSKLIEIKNQYSINQYGIEQTLLTLLEQSEVFLNQIGKSALESKVSTLRSYLTTAINGINPHTLGLIKTNKRKIIKSASFHCLFELSVILENEINEVNDTLNDSQKTLSQVVLSLIQAGGLAIEEIVELNSVQDIALLWNSLITENKQIALIDMQLKQNIIKEDIFLLIQNIINNLKDQ